MTDIDYMKMAHALALKGRGKTAPNPMVGALIVKGGHIIARGWHRKCGGPHAEIYALRQAREKARGAKMYVTLEPCFHVGRTPPCVDAIIKSRIKEVIIGIKDPNPLVRGKSIRKLKKAGIKVRCGLCQDEIRALNEAFIKYIQQRLPFVVIKTAQTLDGKIATSCGQSKWITSKKTRALARGVRNDFDAILVGINTVMKDDPRLTPRDRTKRLRRVILDPSLAINPSALVFNHPVPADIILVTTDRSSNSKRRLFEKKGYEIIVAPCHGRYIRLTWLMRELAKREISSVLIEGGAHTIGHALREKVADKMHVYISPKIIGDREALNSIVGLHCKQIKKTIGLKDVVWHQIGEDLFLQGYIQYN